jgi:hypothetical protein
MTITVGHIGTGRTGREALRAIISDPALELGALVVTTPEKAGRDAGDLCGLPSVGVEATLDLDAVVDMGLDCFSYGGSVIGREAEACHEMARFLERGVDVVTFALASMVYAPMAPPELATPIASACETGGSTFYASGMEPGWASFSVPYTLLAVAGEVEAYREEQHAFDMATAYPVKQVVFGSMGFGQPDGTVPPRFVDGVCAKWWVPNLHVVADALGVKIESTEFRWETHATAEDLETNLGPVAAGTIGATFWELEAVTEGGARVYVDYIARVAHAAPVPDHWPVPSPGLEQGGITYRIDGRPSFKLDFQPVQRPGDRFSSSLAMTALHTINAIPTVVEAGPGHLTPLDLPPYTARGVSR